MSSFSMSRKGNLYRSEDGILLGVCEGMAEYWDFHPWGVRGIVILAQCLFPLTFVAYIAAAFLLKKPPRYYY
jgi:phage shock protein PspC (stress-responsive transcriptional regulator)